MLVLMGTTEEPEPLPVGCGNIISHIEKGQPYTSADTYTSPLNIGVTSKPVYRDEITPAAIPNQAKKVLRYRTIAKHTTIRVGTNHSL